MQSTPLTLQDVQDIDARVAKVLRGLGDPEPPLRLEDVRELLTLDLHYYSSSDTGCLQETISRLKVAGKQVVKRPGLLLDVIRKMDLRALWVPDRKRILLDRDIPPLKWRWNEGHEIGHSLLPWHQAVMLGDDRSTLAPSSKQRIEAEANYASGRLLFMRTHFDERLLSSPIDCSLVRQLAKTFGNTISTTLWRTIETVQCPAVGLISQHPARRPDPEKPMVRYLISSPRFRNEFSHVGATYLVEQLRENIGSSRNGPLGTFELPLVDANGDEHLFRFEAFHNSYETLTLGMHQCKRVLTLAV
ncbi:hypothetical protein Pla108_13390 [Botrimarina colliarenosi]|uniref:Uncharacterized protein n=1 Tax=Botrimarina colliarenosi TaxID=2528001 RepID=A0A5C6AM89_9BACT|nr:ImmA/IrrE family metallo-endopeptidase [Botrimarina colliarenosi]TWU00389.1 hypothetical protein Pla108_13390 [Botrimarina colliarenosi]